MAFVSFEPAALEAGVYGHLLDAAFLLVGGLFGVLLCWLALSVLEDRPKWFISASAVLASAWLVVFPIGTLIGYLMFQWRKD